MKLRSYQLAAVDAVYDHLRNRDDNPVAVLPTGAGKSLVLAKIASDAVHQWSGRVLILAHVKELLEQNADKVRRLCPDIKVGRLLDLADAGLVAPTESITVRSIAGQKYDRIIKQTIGELANAAHDDSEVPF